MHYWLFVGNFLPASIEEVVVRRRGHGREGFIDLIRSDKIICYVDSVRHEARPTWPTVSAQSPPDCHTTLHTYFRSGTAMVCADVGKRSAAVALLYQREETREMKRPQGPGDCGGWQIDELGEGQESDKR